MKATVWSTLSEFIQYLGRTGKCTVEETERGFTIRWIERDAGLLARQAAVADAQKEEEAAEEARARALQDLARMAQAAGMEGDGTGGVAAARRKATAIDADDSERKAVKLTSAVGSGSTAAAAASGGAGLVQEEDQEAAVDGLLAGLGGGGDEEEDDLQRRSVGAGAAPPLVVPQGTTGALPGFGSMAGSATQLPSLPSSSSSSSSSSSVVPRASSSSSGSASAPKFRVISLGNDAAPSVPLAGASGSRPGDAAGERAGASVLGQKRSREEASSGSVGGAASGAGASAGGIGAAGTVIQVVPVPPGGEPWVLRGLVVRVVDRAAGGGAWFRKKGTVSKVDTKGAPGTGAGAATDGSSDPLAEVELQHGLGVAHLRQSQLETLLARPGGAVRVVRGEYVGVRGTVHAVSADGSSLDVLITEGGPVGAVLRGLGPDDVCKRDVEWEARRAEKKSKKKKKSNKSKRARTE